MDYPYYRTDVEYQTPQQPTPADFNPLPWDMEGGIGWFQYNVFGAENSAGIYPSPPLSQRSESYQEGSSIGINPSSASMQSSHSSSPRQNLPEQAPREEDDVVSISTSFCPGSHSTEPDLIFCSSDDVLFYVHPQIILSAAPSAFASSVPQTLGQIGTMPRGTIIKISETASTLNIILHTIYGSSCAQNSPSLDDLTSAVDSMPFHGIVPRDLILPRTPLYTLILSHAPLRPIDVYALAAHHNLEPLAEQTSSHLLAFPLSNINDDLAKRIGPVYLKRLFLLHVHRLAALKEFFLQPPHPHAPTKQCSFENQKGLTRAWALTASYLVWDARPDLPTHRIQSSFESVVNDVQCKECHKSASARIREVIVKWAAVKCTI